jgi:hypothetical protein
LLLYGVGSKKKIVNEFIKKKLKEYNILEIEGYNTEVNFNRILSVILNKVFKLETKCGSNTKISSKLKKIFLEEINKEKKIFYNTKLILVVHNIEGANLRGEAQELLSYIADHPAFKLIATFDHFKTPCLWNSQISSRFNFYYLSVHSMIPYKEEMKFEITQEFSQDEHNA